MHYGRHDRERQRERAALAAAVRWGRPEQERQARARLEALSALEALERVRLPLDAGDLARLHEALAAIPEASAEVQS